MSVGVPEIDRQHQRLIYLFNGLEEGLLRGSATRILRGLLAELVSYTKYHFTTETNILRLDGYRGLASHVQSHDEFVAKLEALEPLLQREGADTVAMEANRFLRSWIVRHIIVADRLAFTDRRPKRVGETASAVAEVSEAPADGSAAQSGEPAPAGG
jgi:hemerythrin